MASELTESIRDLFQLFTQSGLVDRTIETGENRGVWLPMAVLLRVCRYRAPVGPHDPLDYVRVRKMLIHRQVLSCLEISDFARTIAPFCQEPAARRFAQAYLNTFLPQAANRLSPFLDHLREATDARLVVSVDGMSLALSLPPRRISREPM